MQNGDEPASASTIALVVGDRNIRRDLIPREEHLTSEDWAIMAAVERCTVWRSVKSLNLRQREKLLAAICMVFQESVEGNANRSTVNAPEDFRDWGRRWGQDEDAAQLVMQNQWDNLLRHIMGITTAMEVWEPSAASSSGGEAHGTGGNPANALEVEGHWGEQERQAPRGEENTPPSKMRTSTLQTKKDFPKDKKTLLNVVGTMSPRWTRMRESDS